MRAALGSERSRELHSLDPFLDPALDDRLDELLDLDGEARAARLRELAVESPAQGAVLCAFLAAAETDDPLARPASELAAALIAVEQPTPSRVGELVGPFRVVGELGRGGMGTVYAGERAEGGFDQQVAIKVVKGGYDSADVLRRFLAERRILAQLAHPHIARLLDGGATPDGLPWFAMERVNGVPITDYAERERLPLRRRLELFLDVCDAVAAAHRSLIVHRDLKPSNVLVGASGEVKLLDFGIAKLLSDSPDGGSTRTELRPMTPRYAAPEQERGGAISTLTDVWQLGRLLEELLAQPVPRDVERIVARARHDEPERRYRSVEALAEDLRRYLDGRAVEARGDSPWYRAARFVRRHRLGVAAAALVTLALIAGLAIALWQASVARREAERARIVKEYLVSTFGEARPEVAKGEDTTAREILERGIARIDRDLERDPDLHAEMLGVVADIQTALGAFDKAAALYERQVQLLRTSPASVVAPALAEADLARVMAETYGELDRAESLAQAAFDTVSRELGPRAVETLEVLATLAGVHRRQGKLEEAERELRACLDGLRDALPDDDPSITGAIDGLANTLFDQSRYAEAEVLFRELLGRAERAHGPESLAAAHAWSDIGSALDESDQNAPAEEAMLRALELFRRLLGEDHPTIGRTLKNLGALYQSTGRLQEARRALSDAAALFERSLGPDSYDRLSALNTLAIVDYQAGAYEAAEASLRSVVEGFRRTQGLDHPDTLSLQSNLAAVLSELGELEEAEALQRDVIARRVATDDRSGSLPISYHVLGNILLRGKRPTEAIEAYDEAVRQKIAMYGPSDPLVANSVEAAARARLAREHPADLEEAGDLLEKAQAIVAAHPDFNPDFRADLLVTSARLDLLRAQAAVALPRLEESVRLRSAANGEAHWKTAEARLHLGRALAMLGRVADARRELDAAIAALAQLPGRKELLAEARRAAGTLPPA